ncbi:MAG: diol dehydratase reactivase, partial [Mycolicibacterium frederiksbergense]|nr:diol dehydratase reactivase [Mycolicibacterium frederiksbergense]
MTVWAGVDIGNATTEVVLCRAAVPNADASRAPTDLEMVASARTPTRGGKGSVRAVQVAAQLVRRLADKHGLTIDRAAFAPTRPVHSSVERVRLQAQRTGRLGIVTRSAATTAGDAAGFGVPVAVARLGTADR